jgi:sterol desaturase/sphingolipid hydroxylase (fatty acid hydroxylase superfamily)
MISIIVLGLAGVMILVELLVGARPWPRIAGWWRRAIALNAIQFGIALLAGFTWERLLVDWRLWSVEGLGVTGSALVGYVAITFIYYWWHRARHQVPFLWRWLHQVHHSPSRIEIITSYYKHPVEIVINSILSTLILYLLIGVGTEAAAYAILLTGLAELFYHWNVRTPHWLGYLVQRPESHCVHHQQHVHHFNYADLPLWDMLFGTFRNPSEWRSSCGFEGNREERLGDMLRGKVVE